LEKTYLCKTVQFMQNHTNCEVQMGNIGSIIFASHQLAIHPEL